MEALQVRAQADITGDGILAITAELNNPSGVAVSNAGLVYIADYNNNRIRYMPKPTIINTVHADLSAQIFPNPNEGIFTIMLFSAIKEAALISITDATGKLLKETRISTKSQTEIRVDEAGIYFIEASTTSGKWRDKIVVIK